VVVARQQSPLSVQEENEDRRQDVTDTPRIGER
jgi:hypothetical protein